MSARILLGRRRVCGVQGSECSFKDPGGQESLDEGHWLQLERNCVRVYRSRESKGVGLIARVTDYG